MSRTKNATRNILAGMISKVISIIVPFLIRTLIIKKLGADYLGLNSLFVSILQVLSLAEMGFGNAVVFSMYKPIAENNFSLINALYSFYKKVYRVIGSIMLIVGLAVIPFLPYLISGDYPSGVNIYIIYIVFLSNTVISYWLFAYKDSLLQAHQRYDVSSNITLFTNCGMYALQIIALCFFKNYYAYIFVLPLATVANNIVKSIIVNKMYPNIVCDGSLSREQKKELYKKIAGLLAYKICGICRNSFDSIVISTFLGLVILAKYQNYFIIITSIVSVLGIIIDSIISGIGNSIVNESREKNHKDFNTLFFMLNWIAAWCMVCLTCLYQPFIELWLGKDYLLGDSLPILLGIYFYLQQIGNVGYVYRTAAGLWWENKLCPIVESIANLLMNFLFVRFWGIEGVVVATIVSMLFINLPWSSFVLFKKYFCIKPYKYWLKIVGNLIITIIVAVFTRFISNMINLDGFIGLGIKAVVCLIIPNVLFLLIFLRSKYFKSSKALIFNMIKSLKTK